MFQMTLPARMLTRLLIMSLLAACSGSPVDLAERERATVSTPAAGRSGAVSSFATAGSGLSSQGPDAIAPTGPAGVIPLTDSQVCDADVYGADRKRLDIYMMVDDSASMLFWWADTITAIQAFFDDPASADVGVGVQFFGTECDVERYAQPRVPIAPLSQNAGALKAAFPPIPLDETSTLPALQGAIKHARGWASTHPDARTIVLLVTDGLPEECNSTVENVTQAAREGFEGSPSITTFVVGIGNIVALDQFAAAGGSGHALITQPGAGPELVRALNTIRGAALPCEFAVPAAASGPVQPDQINLRYEHPEGARLIGAVRDQASCSPTQGGWYFDNPSAPRRVIACEQSCRELNGGGSVKVLLGCPTVLL